MQFLLKYLKKIVKYLPSFGNPSGELIKEKLLQLETLAITEKLHLIWKNRLALIVAIIFGMVVPGLVLDFKLKAEGSQTDAATFLGIPVPSVVWIVATLALGLVSLNSLFSTFGLMVPRGLRSNVFRTVICLGVEIAWVAIVPRRDNGADWYELIFVVFLLLLIIFSNAVCFGSWIAEWQEQRDSKAWVQSHAARHEENKKTILALQDELTRAMQEVELMRDWFTRVQKMIDDCPRPRNGACVLEIDCRKRPGDKEVRHEISLREDDVRRTNCPQHAPVVLSDPLLNCPTRIGRASPQVDGPSGNHNSSKITPGAGETRQIIDENVSEPNSITAD